MRIFASQGIKPPFKRRPVCLGVCFFALISCIPGGAIDRDRRIDQLYHTSWTLKDGAPAEIFAITQTVDGFLWLGTTSGLVRFDGVRFENFEPPLGPSLPARNVSSLLALPDGTLGIGFGAGGVSFLKDGIVKTYTDQGGLPDGTVRALVKDREGTIWAATLGGLARMEGSRWRAAGADWGFSGSATAAFVDRKGALWVGTPDSLFFLPDGAKQFRKVGDHLSYVTRLGEASDGTIWMAVLGESVRPALGLENIHRAAPEIRVASIAFLFDHQGSVWVTSLGSGLSRMPYPERSSQTAGKPNAVDVFTQAQGLSSDYSESIFEDREGDIWIGTNAGLDRFRQSTVVNIQLAGPMSYKSLMAGDDGTVLVGVAENNFVQIRDGRVMARLTDQFQPIRNVGSNCLYRDPEGVVWLATARNLLRLAGRRLDQIDYPPGSGGSDLDRKGSAIAMTADKSGRLWVSIFGNGVFRRDDRRWTAMENLGGPKGVAISAFTGSDGRVWLGYGDKTIVVVDGDKIRVFSDADDGQLGRVRCIHGRSSNVWIGGDEGVARFDGRRFRALVPSTGERFRDVFGIVETADDGLWFSEHNGIVHISKSEVQLFEKDPNRRVDYQAFSLLDGLPAPLQKSSVIPSVIEGTDGKLWFATTQGLAWLDPKRIARNALPPPVSIESVVADGKHYSPSEAIALPALTAEVNFAYTGLTLSIPERVQFRYRLEGLGQDWQAAGTRREAFYTNPGPGSYRFHVLASNNDGVWNETGAAIGLVIAPAFYQTIWFRSLCVLAVAGIIRLLYLLRLRQATAQIQARLGERLVERERIARELHDTLLQGFNGLVLRFEAVMKQMPPGVPARHMMESALERADEVLLEGRQRVRDLRSESGPGNDLAVSLADCGQELSGDGAPTFSLATLGEPRPLDPIALDEVYRIGREAIANAFQHSQGSKIEAEITYDREALRLRVRDDGRGIDESVLSAGRPGHWGLTGIRERAQNIGGQLSIWSSPAAGTELELIVPAHVAYQRGPKPLRPRWLKWALWGGDRLYDGPEKD
jgi:signal transduction histidine kinase/ligand-binding sensor domain-containing protein